MVEFFIDHLDPLAQGVSKRVDRNNKSTITFIPKTLPGEQGAARVIKSAKGVEFGELESLVKTSPQRITPECEHYTRCSGCDYLHVSYDDEVQFKLNALKFLLRNFNLPDENFSCFAAPARFGYRNRVQLHYRHKYLGLIDASSDQVLEVPHCKLVTPAIKQAMDQLYQDKSWAAQHTGRGHIELYEKEGTVQQAWDKDYASGGFSQVNAGMNDKLCEFVITALQNQHNYRLLDLFSGAGNLSDGLMSQGAVQRQLVDSSPGAGGNENYLQLDLYDDEALHRYLRRATLKEIDVLLLDPPRKGFPALAQWASQFKPKMILYVSCNPASLARDLQSLVKAQKKTGYQIKKVVMLDMFPGTRHFESIVVMENTH